MSGTYPTVVGAGFIILDGPPGPTGEAFPVIRELTDELVSGTQDRHTAALLQAVQAGHRAGDFFVTPSGQVYVLSVIDGQQTLEHVGSLAGPKGATGGLATAPPHTLADHGIPNPVEFMPGNYGELRDGPVSLPFEIAFPTGP
jgi:hypothetical protein